MRSNADWQHAQPGVLLYMPSTRVSVENAEHSLSQLSVMDSRSHKGQSQLSNVSDSIVPTIEHDTKIRIKSEPSEEGALTLLRDDSPDTLAGSCKTERLIDVSPVAKLTPESTTSSDFLFQLLAAARDGSPETSPIFSDTLEFERADLNTEDNLEAHYDSERTDFLEDIPSPSLQRDQGTRTHANVTRVGYFDPVPPSLTGQPVARLLNFGGHNRRRSDSRSKSGTTTRGRGALEKVPSHNYTSDERELLCLINRFYASTDDYAISKLFNAITGLELRHSVIETYVKHLCLYGPKAYRALARVLSVPLNDPDGCYANICFLIEQKAHAIGVQLTRRDVEPNVQYGGAAFRRSPNTRKCFKTLVRKAREEAKEEAARSSLVGYGSTVTPSADFKSAAVRLPLLDYSEVLTDAEQTPSPPIETAEAESVVVPDLASSRPHIAFRVWDDDSRAIFSEEQGFTSEMFGATAWNGSPVEPFLPSGQGLNALLMFATFHMSMRSKVPSAFVSVSTSLLQVFCKASTMSNPRLAIIDMNHPTLQEDHKMLHASEVLPWLKSYGQARWARYKGRTEYLVWAGVPRAAIIHYFSLSELQNLARQEKTCRDILKLDEIIAGRATPTVSRNIGKQKSMLNTQTAKAMAQIARTFAMNGSNASLEHLRSFIAELINGWSINITAELDIHTCSHLASTFATTLLHSSKSVQCIMHAFNEGVKEGARLMTRYGRSSQI